MPKLARLHARQQDSLSPVSNLVRNAVSRRKTRLCCCRHSLLLRLLSFLVYLYNFSLLLQGATLTCRSPSTLPTPTATCHARMITRKSVGREIALQSTKTIQRHLPLLVFVSRTWRDSTILIRLFYSISRQSLFLMGELGRKLVSLF